MSDDTEYELYTLCQKLVTVLSNHKCLVKGTAKSPFNKAFSPTFKKVKKQGYVKFNDFLSDVKNVFGNLKKASVDESADVEELFARELKNLINLDYYDKSGDDSDTSDSLHLPNKMEKPLSKNKKLKLKTGGAKQEKIKIKLKLTPDKLGSRSMSSFDFDDNTNKVQSLCTGLLRAATVSSDVQKNFTQLPDRELFPDYYDIIQLPISLSMIKAGITAGHYTNIFHCFSDVLIMCLNAKAYNEPRTAVYDQSLEIVLSIKEHMQGLSSTDKLLTTPVNPQYELSDYTLPPGVGVVSVPSENYIDIWEMFNKVVGKCNKSGRPLTPTFLLLPDRTEFPVYYEEISTPSSLCKIRSKLICGRYQFINDIVMDLSVTFDNAIQFNKKSSVIHKDAAALKDYINTLCIEFTEQVKKVTKRASSSAQKTPVVLSSPESKPKISEKKRASQKSTPAGTPSPEGKSKIGQKRRASQISHKNPPATPTPECKAEIIEVTDIAESRSQVSIDFVRKCFKDLKNSGPGLQSELTQCCTTFHQIANDIHEFEEILEEVGKPREVLLKVVCALMSRLDPLCMEYAIIDSTLVKLVDVNKDVTELIDCLPTYTYQDKSFFLQEELMSIFRLTAYSKILSHNSNISRISKPKSEIYSAVPQLDILSENVVLVDAEDVKRILITPMTKLVKKAKLSKLPDPGVKAPTTPKTPNVSKTIKSESSKTPKSESSKTPKSESSKTPKSKKASEKQIKIECKTEDDKPIVKKVCVDKSAVIPDKSGMLEFVNYIRDIKTSSGEPQFDDFFEVPRSKTYHSIIKYPMCLDTITEQIEEGKLRSLDEVISACLLIVQNARYYNEESADVYKTALLLQKTLLSRVTTSDSNETVVCVNKLMLQLMTDIKENTEITELTENTNTKFSSMSFSQLYERVKTGYYTRVDALQDAFLQMLIPLLNENLFGTTATKILSVFRYYLTVRDRTTQLRSRCFELNTEKFLTHFQDRLDIVIPESSISCLSYNNTTYMVGEKVLVQFSEDDLCVLHINVISSPCWVAGTVYLLSDDTIYKTDIKDVVHVKYIVQKLSKRYKYMSYNYRNKTVSDIVTNINRSVYSKTQFKSFYSLLSLSKYNPDTIIHGTVEHKTYYLQYVRDNGDVFKLGDYIYLRSDSQLPYIARIDKIHKDKKEDEVFVYGPWFIRPSDTRFYESKTFYPNEVVMSNITDTNHINSVEGICQILYSKDYITRHPLAILNKDVYICDGKYDESAHKFSKLAKLYLALGPGDRQQDEWYVQESPRKLHKSSKPPFITPVQYDVDSSSDEEEEGDESTSDESYCESALRVSKTPQQHSTPRTYSKTPVGRASSDLYSRINVNKAIAINNSLISHASHVTNNYTPYNNKTNNSSTYSGYTPHTRCDTPPRVSTPNHHTNHALIQQSSFSTVRNSVSATSGKLPGLKCEWENCEESFTDSNEFYIHVINTETHLSAHNEQWKCAWKSCSDQKAKSEGCVTQILLRRHLLEHMRHAGYTPGAPAKTLKILRHSETYKTFLKKLIIPEQDPDQMQLED